MKCFFVPAVCGGALAFFLCFFACTGLYGQHYTDTTDIKARRRGDAEESIVEKAER